MIADDATNSMSDDEGEAATDEGTPPFYFTVGPSTSAKPETVLERRIREWMQWWMFADKHRYAARCLIVAGESDRRGLDARRTSYSRERWPPFIHDQALMHMGFALENLAKGATVPALPAVLTPHGKLASELKHHDIRKLVGGLQITERPGWGDFLRMATVVVSGPNARYPVPASKGESVVLSSAFSYANLWKLFDEIFEALTVELLRRNAAQVEIILPQYQLDEECRFPCSHEEWVRWSMHGEIPPWLSLPPRPTKPFFPP